MAGNANSGRRVGDFGAKTLYWRSLLTNEAIEKAYNNLVAMLDSEDIKDRQWAIKMMMDKFHISAERMLEIAQDSEEREMTKEMYDMLKKQALGE